VSLTPKRFFEVVLPHMVLRSFGDFLKQQGTMSFEIEGEGGGQWSFTFGKEEPVLPGLAPAATLQLKFTRASFDGFIEGTLDVVAAVRAKEVTARGRDFYLLEAFGRLLKPPSRDLGYDVQTVG
jgi:hypothetical protein